MQELQSVAIVAGAAAARYAKQYQQLFEASTVYANESHSSSGTSVYRILDWSITDVQLAAVELDDAGRRLVGHLAQHMQQRIKYGEKRRFSFSGRFVHRFSDDLAASQNYAEEKEAQHPVDWPKPADWLMLIGELPKILEQLLEAAPATS